jgi:hypothetical protein
MMKRFGFLIVLMSSLSFAQNSCPEGLYYAGTLSGTDAEEFDKTVFIKLPEAATLDESYQQTEVRASSGKQKTKSNLRPQDIPKGIHITPYGSDTPEKTWIVSEPRLREIKDGVSSRYAFGCTFSVECKAPRLPKQKGPAMWRYGCVTSQSQETERCSVQRLSQPGGTPQQAPECAS